jgi:hypothetical protein
MYSRENARYRYLLNYPLTASNVYFIRLVDHFLVGCRLGTIVIFLLLAFRQHVGHDALTFRDPFTAIFVRVHDKLIVRDTKHPTLFQLLGTRKMHKNELRSKCYRFGAKNEPSWPTAEYSCQRTKSPHLTKIQCISTVSFFVPRRGTCST